MPDLMQRGASWLATKLVAGVSQTVTYRRGSLSVSLAATKCPVRSELDQTFGILKIGECDWIIKASLIVLGAVTVEPERNDEIEEADGQKWHVLPTTDEDTYRPLDPYRTAFRIHTKRIAEDS